MNGFDWNGNDKRDSFDNYMDYKASGSDQHGRKYNTNGGDDFGCGWVVIVIVAIMLIFFFFSGASWDAIDSLLGFGFLAFLFARALFK